MDLVAMTKEAFRYRAVTIPILALTFLLAIYFVAIKAPTYEAQSSYALVAPPNPPSATQIAANPALGRVNSNNPYVSYGDLTDVVALVSQAMSGAGLKQQLHNEGIDGSYTIAQNVDASAPIVDITATAGSPAAATYAATRVANLTIATLGNLQRAQHVNRRYWITAQQLTPPDKPTAKLSSKIRAVIAIIGIGLIAWFIALSIVRGLAEQRASRPAKPPTRRIGSGGRSSSVSDDDGGMGASQRLNGMAKGATRGLAVVARSARTKGR
jgi:capsular polysaccharide biosynthesis protein